MTSELQTRLRKELEDERESALAELASYGADPRTGRVARPEGIDDNFADSASATAERSEMLAFIDKARDRLEAVEIALHKMDEGTYGICERCQAEIPEARLEARPLSVRCVACASKS